MRYVSLACTVMLNTVVYDGSLSRLFESHRHDFNDDTSQQRKSESSGRLLPDPPFADHSLLLIGMAL